MEKGPGIKIPDFKKEDNGQEKKKGPEQILADSNKLIGEIEDTLHKYKGERAESEGEMEEILNGTQICDSEKLKNERINALEEKVKGLNRLIERYEISEERLKTLIQETEAEIARRKKIH